MANENNIKMFTALDIEKYHKGLLSPQERHALEKAALDDPFLADALEGYFTTPVNIAADIDELKKRLADKTADKDKVVVMNSGATKTSFPWLRAAAVIVILFGAGLIAYQITGNKKEQSIAQANKDRKEKSISQDSNLISVIPSAVDTSSANISGLTDELQQKADKITPNGNATLKVPVTGTTFLKADSVVTYYTNSNAVVTAPSKSQTDTAAINFGILAEINFKAEELKKESRAKKAAAEQDKQTESIARAEPRQESYNKPNAAAAGRAMNEQYRANNFKGRVTDAYNNGVPFANVTNVRDNVGTYTDARGFFNLTSPDTTLSVQVRGLGFNDNIIQLKNNVSSNQVVMQEDKSVAAQTLSGKKVNYEKYARDANMKMEDRPEPEDGWENYDSYLSNNLTIPEEVKTKQMDNGRVEVSFEVNKYGAPVNIKVEKSLCNTCDQEAIRLIREGPKWKRKAKKGRTTVTVSF